jgi:Winged helix-turn helix
MKPSLYIRHLTEDERTAHEAGLRSSDAFTVRPCQILLASAEKHTPAEIAKTLRCAPQMVRHVLHAFDAHGLTCVQRGSNVPITVEPVLNAEKREQVRAILHQSPRTFGQPASVWTLKRLAAVCHEQGLSDTTLSCPTMLDAIVRLGVSWHRAQHWIVSPDPAYERKKAPRPADPDGRQPSGRGVGLRR